MKKIFLKAIGLLLSTIMFISCATATTQAAEQTQTTRDTVLLLDISDSMQGTPLDVMKSSALKFCRQVFESEGNNRIALVIYDSSSISYNFQSTYDSLANIIEDIEMGAGTDIAEALQAADSLMRTNSTQEAIKNIVLLTDGVPFHGSTSYNGPYTSADDERSYPYANAAYAFAETIKPNYNIYTLGFFHNLTGDRLAFGKRFLYDIQNAGYYDVTNVEDLEFIFGDIADDVTQDKYPIIIIPGVMGSSLYSDNKSFSVANRVWVPDYENHLSTIVGLGKRISIGNVLYVKPPENQVKLAESKREYGTFDTYKPLVDDLCKTYKEVYFFSYDWRNSNLSSAQKLNEFIESLSTPKVNLVCHSMGGIIGSCYVSAYGMEKINKIITCGTPYEGSPANINIIQNWDLKDDDKENVAVWKNFDPFHGNLGEADNDLIDTVLGTFGGLTKSVKRELPAVAELLPTEDYVNLIPMWRDNWKPFSLGDKNISTSDYIKIAKKLVGEKNYNNAVTTHNFITSKNGNYGVLADYDNAFFIIGTGKPTISSIKFQFSNIDIDETLRESDIDYSIKGDGTVPYASATMAEYLSKNNQNVFVLDNTDHGNTATGSKAIETIKSILDDNPMRPDEVSDKKYIVIRIACPVDVELELNGSVLSSDPDSMSIRTDYGRYDMLGQNNEIKLLCVETSSEYELLLSGTDSGTMDYEIRWFNENDELVDSKTFSDVAIEEGTKITTTTNEDNIILSVDSDGDGNIDENIRPDKKSFWSILWKIITAPFRLLLWLLGLL